jgi:hypothetical protein
VSASPPLLRRRSPRVTPRRQARSRLVRSPRLVVLLSLAALVAAPGGAATTADETPPAITITIFGTLGANGWYTSSVTVNWTISEPDGPLTNSNCQLATTLVADTAGTELVCMAESAGGETRIRKTIKIDKTAPAVSVAAERQPDANGWFNRPVTVSFSGTDATAGIESCSSVRYSGPDSANAAVAGSCRDNAGNVSRSSFAFRYDATPPSVSAVRAIVGNRSARLTWRASSDTRVVEVARAPGRNRAAETVVFRGLASTVRDTGLTVARRYRYRVTVFDEAANSVAQTALVTATGRLLSPAPGARVTSPPFLQWTPVKRATYYNLQLIRGRKVLSAWPVRAGFQLRRTWLYNGRRYRLRPGVYRWYVWPGFGRRSESRYGRRLGSSTFVVPG